MDGYVRPEGVYVFEAFRLDPRRRVLTRGEQRVLLAARLFDTLLFLVENHGRLVSREDLMQAVWPTRTVEPSSLAMAISSLRTALRQHGASETLIITAPGRGYHFGAPVAFEAPPAIPYPHPSPLLESQMPHFPGPLTSATGRARASGLPRATIRRATVIGVCAMLAALAVFRMFPGERNQGKGEDAGIAATAPAPNSIAVLPFTNGGSGPQGDYFAKGLSEELINALGRNASLRVAARMSSFSFEGKPATAIDIGRELHVARLLEGSVQRDGTRVRVTTQLIDTSTGFQVWSRSYDREQGDILVLQSQLAEAAIASLKIVLLPVQIARLTLGGTTDPRAFDAYLSGLPHATDSNDGAEQEAIGAFTRAIALDPNYALAYAERARAFSYLATNSEVAWLGGPAAMMDTALSDAERAVWLAPDLGEAHAALAYVLKSRLSDLARAGAEYQRAVELAPGDATILMRYGQWQIALGHLPAAVEAAEHAAALDPLTPRTYRTLARILSYSRRYDDALAALRHAKSLQPFDPDADRIDLAFVQQWQGDAAGALKTCGGARDKRDLMCLAWAEDALGHHEAAGSAMARLHETMGDNGAYIYANIYAHWGRTADALAWLATAYRLRDPGLIALRIDPMLEPLRGSDLYKRVERDLGLPP